LRQVKSLKPFDASKLYKIDRKTGKRQYRDTTGKPNCTWNSEARSLAEAGLCNGADLQIWNGIRDFL